MIGAFWKLALLNTGTEWNVPEYGSTFLRVADGREKMNDEYFKVKLLSSNSAK